jgi:hypothetical protein
MKLIILILCVFRATFCILLLRRRQQRKLFDQRDTKVVAFNPQGG